MTEGEVATTNGNKTEEEQSPQLAEKIVRQIQYYFGDYNLPRDKFLQQEVSTGFTSLSVIIFVAAWPT